MRLLDDWLTALRHLIRIAFGVFLDFLSLVALAFRSPLGQRHLKDIVNRWLRHYNHGRVHMPLGQAIPVPLHPSPPRSDHRHHIPRGHRVHCKPVLGGLYHEYWLEKIAA